MKNAVPKNDKKRRKQLTEDIAKLEEELSQKHEEELRQLSNTTITAKVRQCAFCFQLQRVTSSFRPPLIFFCIVGFPLMKC